MHGDFAPFVYSYSVVVTCDEEEGGCVGQQRGSHVHVCLNNNVLCSAD